MSAELESTVGVASTVVTPEHKNRSPKLLTQKEIEERLDKRAARMRAKIKKLEKSQIVTKETWDLEFTI